MTEPVDHDFLMLTADIVSAFVGNNNVHASDLPELIKVVHASLLGIKAPKTEAAPPVALTPAVPIKKSITDDYLICLEDGKHFKSLKRHLQSKYGMTPDDYRTKWGLPRDYPMAAPGYAAKRSQLAKDSGLGSGRRKAGQAEVAAPPPNAIADREPDAPARRRGRPAKKAA